MQYTFQTIVCGAYAENAYLLLPENRADALLIDPGDDLDALQSAIRASGRALGAILLTHGHFDHILAAEPLAAEFGAPVYAHADECARLNNPFQNSYNADCSVLPCPKALNAIPLADSVEVCGIRFDVLHTAGHTPGSVCYYDPENARLFSGDTLFCGGVGRTDLFGGSQEEIVESVMKLLGLPGETKVYPGHGESTTIEAERRRLL